MTRVSPRHPHLHVGTAEQLRARRTMKWTAYPDDVLPMWVAEMDFPVCREVASAIERACGAETFGYPSRVAVRELGAAFADWQARHTGWAVAPERVNDVGDVMHGVSLAIRHWSSPGEAVVIPSPVYMPFFEVVELTGRPQVRVPMGWDGERWVLDLDGIDTALAAGARTVLISNPHNPLGRVFERAELAALADVVERHGARVVSDEIHGPLTLDGRPFVPYAAVSDHAAAHSITVTSASKSWNLPGLKCAQLVTHTDADQQRLDALSFWERVGVSTLGIEANLAAYRHGDEWLGEVRETLAEHRDLVAAAVADWPGARTVANEGTYLQWLDFGELGLDEEPATWLLREAKVALNAGAPFGGAEHRFARLNFATTRPLLEEGISRIGRAVRARHG